MPVFSCGRSLFIDWRMVVVAGGNVLAHVNREGNCPGGEMSGGICPRGNILHSDGRRRGVLVGNVPLERKPISI